MLCRNERLREGDHQKGNICESTRLERRRRAPRHASTGTTAQPPGHRRAYMVWHLRGEWMFNSSHLFLQQLPEGSAGSNGIFHRDGMVMREYRRGGRSARGASRARAAEAPAIQYARHHQTPCLPTKHARPGAQARCRVMLAKAGRSARRRWLVMRHAALMETPPAEVPQCPPRLPARHACRSCPALALEKSRREKPKQSRTGEGGTSVQECRAMLSRPCTPRPQTIPTESRHQVMGGRRHRIKEPVCSCP